MERKRGYSGITEGNRSFGKATGEGNHPISAQPFNGKAGHNYRFWRARLGVILKHHFDWLR